VKYLDIMLWSVFASLLAAGLVTADNLTATVNLSVSKGKPVHWASGFIYGIPDTPNQIPDHWYTDIGFRYGRAGGAQLQAPARGWIWGLNEYKGRLESTLSNYRTCRKYGAEFILLPHDVWGTDHTNSSTVWPGDGGDWSDYDLFVKTLMKDLKKNNALKGLVWDIWNEPDISIFWERDQQQWIDLYIRTHKLLRYVSGPQFPIESSSNAGQIFCTARTQASTPSRSRAHRWPIAQFRGTLGGATGWLRSQETRLFPNNIPII
jgi:hypothetical protein